MAFSTRQLFALVLVVALGLAALANADQPIVGPLAKQVVIITLILAAYRAWTSQGEARAFRIGFLLWCGLYFMFHVALRVGNLDFGTSYFLFLLRDLLHPDFMAPTPSGNGVRIQTTLIDGFNRIGHCVLSIVVGFVGGIVTVYFYHKRQQMLAANQPSN